MSAHEFVRGRGRRGPSMTRRDALRARRRRRALTMAGRPARSGPGTMSWWPARWTCARCGGTAFMPFCAQAVGPGERVYHFGLARGGRDAAPSLGCDEVLAASVLES